jgi:hypothetical protein
LSLKPAFKIRTALNTYYSKINNEVRKQKINENSKKYYNENLNKMKIKHNEYYLQTKN